MEEAEEEKEGGRKGIRGEGGGMEVQGVGGRRKKRWPERGRLREDGKEEEEVMVGQAGLRVLSCIMVFIVCTVTFCTGLAFGLG